MIGRRITIYVLAIGSMFLSGLAIWIGWQFFEWAYDRSVLEVDAVGVAIFGLIFLFLSFTAGYCFSAFAGALTRWFWIASATYNLLLSGLLIFVFVTIGFGLSTNEMTENVSAVLPLWTLFAAAFSIYLSRKPKT